MIFPVILAVVAASLMAACIGMTALWLLPDRDLTEYSSIFADTGNETLFLFDGETMIDSTANARALLATSPMQGAAWGRLMAFLTSRFENLESQLQRLQADGAIELPSLGHTKPLILRAEHTGGLTRLTLIDAAKDGSVAGGCAIAQRAMLDELALLRETVATAPMLLWRENPAGDVVWANGPYLLQACAILDEGKDLGWPLPRLFNRTAAKSGRDQRQSLSIPGKSLMWFDISSKPEVGRRFDVRCPC